MIKNIYKKIIPEKKRIRLIEFFYKITAFIYLGNKYYCNCCENSFRKFLPKGNIKRENAQCPYCLSLERTRVLDLYLTNELKLYEQSDLRILHFAPETCLYNKIKKLPVEYIDCDINAAYANYVADITNIPYGDNTFDLIICSHVLGHVPHEHKAITEMLRVLKPDGKALVMTLINPNSEFTIEDRNVSTSQERLAVYGEPDLCRLHGRDFEKRLSDGGFVVTKVDYRIFTGSGKFKTMQLGNGDRELIFVCQKK